MMFIIRTMGETPPEANFSIRLTRRTSALASGGIRDFFCDGDPDAVRQQGLHVVPVHDGWYADDTGGGVAIWGQGRFWEIRDTPFTVRETSAELATPEANSTADDEVVNVRKAIFGA